MLHYVIWCGVEGKSVEGSDDIFDNLENQGELNWTEIDKIK